MTDSRSRRACSWSRRRASTRELSRAPCGGARRRRRGGGADRAGERADAEDDRRSARADHPGGRRGRAVAGDTRLAGRLQGRRRADRNAAWATSALAVESFRPKRIVGAGNIHSRHAAMEAGELDVDYLFFGRPHGDTHDAPHPKALDLAEWWSELMQMPAVIMAGRSLDSVARRRRDRRRFRRAARCGLVASRRAGRSQCDCANAVLRDAGTAGRMKRCAACACSALRSRAGLAQAPDAGRGRAIAGPHRPALGVEAARRVPSSSRSDCNGRSRRAAGAAAANDASLDRSDRQRRGCRTTLDADRHRAAHRQGR